jgi:transposase
MIDTIFGVDISSATSNAALLINGVVVNEFTISNDRIGFEEFGKQLDRFPGATTIFEATGVYSMRFQAFLQRGGYPHVTRNPLAAKRAMQGDGNLRHSKTDSLDAIGLAMDQHRHHHPLDVAQDPVYTQLRDESRFYQEINGNVVQNKNRLHKLLQLTFPEIEGLMRHDELLYWRLVKHFPHPATVPMDSVSDLAGMIRELAVKGIGIKRMGIKRAFTLAQRLMELADKAYAARGSASHLLQEVSYTASEVERLVQLKFDIVDMMIKQAASLPEFAKLVSIPGIGECTAVMIIAEFGDIRRFHSANAMNAYIGIDLPRVQSGQFTATDLHITKTGNAVGRKILFYAIIQIIAQRKKHPTNISLFWDRKKQSSPKTNSKKIAIAAIHRLNRTLYHLIKLSDDEELYKPNLAQSQAG